jgi:NADH:ubiquinone oxidoreductase subunit K
MYYYFIFLFRSDQFIGILRYKKNVILKFFSSELMLFNRIENFIPIIFNRFSINETQK